MIPKVIINVLLAVLLILIGAFLAVLLNDLDIEVSSTSHVNALESDVIANLPIAPQIGGHMRPQMEISIQSTYNESQRRSPRPGERCYKYSNEIILDHGANGDCFVVDNNMIIWFINPANRRIPFDCSKTGLKYVFRDSWQTYYKLPEITHEYPHPITAYTEDVYRDFACTSWEVPSG